MKPLRILVLGQPAVTYAGEPVTIQRRFIRTFFYYLACQRDRIARSQLALMFWPDAPDDKARQNLRETLSKLKGALPDDSLLIADHDQVSFDRSRVYLDMHEFQELNRQVQQSAHVPHMKPLPPHIYEQLFKAVNLWRSPQFLPGISFPDSVEFDEWVTVNDQTLGHARQTMIERLAGHAIAIGDLEEAVRWLRLALSGDNNNMELNYRLLECLEKLGRRAEALNHFIFLRNLYERDEGSRNLPPNFVTLHKKLLNQSSQPYVPPNANWPDAPVIQTPYVGRFEAISQLQRAYHRGGVVLIYGEAGAGKTRLAYEFSMKLNPPPRLLVTRAHPLERRIPFQSLIDGLRRLNQPLEWEQLDAITASHLLRLVPEKITMRPDLRVLPQPGGEEAFSGIFEAGRKLLLLMAQNQPILLFLDDAQWSDESTLAALAYAIEHGVFPEHGLIVLAIRSEENNPFLPGFLESIQRYTPVTTIQLEQLEAGEVSELAGYVLGRVLPAEGASRLAKDTGGNPLLLMEALHYLLELPPGTELTEAIAQMPLVGSIKSLLHERLRKVHDTAHGAINAAAVIGTEFTPDLIETTANLKPDDVVKALEELENAHLVRSRTGGVYYFIHEKIRETILSEISPARRRLLHLRAATALQTSSSEWEASLAVLAQHYQSAGQLSTAFTYWWKAGKYASKLSSLHEAYSAFERAEQLLQKTDYMIAEEQIYNCYIEWGEVAVSGNDVATAQACFGTLQKVGEQEKSPLLVGSALSGLANCMILTNQPGKAMAMLERAIPLLEQSGNIAEQIYGYHRLCRALVWMSRFAETRQYFQRVTELCDQAVTPRALQAKITIYNYLSLIYSLQGWPARAHDLSAQALQISERTLNDYGIMESSAQLALAAYLKGSYHETLDICHSGLLLTESAHNWSQACQMHLTAARTHLFRAELDISWQHVQQALTYARQYKIKEYITAGICFLGDIYNMLLDYSRCIPLYQQGIGQVREYYQTMDISYHLALAMIHSGDRQKGMEMLEQTLSLAKAAELGTIYLEATYRLALLDVAQGKSEAALEKCDMLAMEYDRRGISFQKDLLWIRVQIELQAGNLQAALELVENLIVYTRQEEFVFFEIEGLILIQKIQHLLKNPDAEPARQLNRLLERLDECTQVKEFRPSLGQFLDKIRARFSNEGS